MIFEKFAELQRGKNDVGERFEILMKICVLLVFASGCQIHKRMTSSKCRDAYVSLLLSNSTFW